MNITKFEPGRTYTGSNTEGGDGVVSITIASRTENSITLVSGQTFYPGIYNSSEFIKPLGNHAMSPTVYAAKFLFLQRHKTCSADHLLGVPPQIF